MGIKEQSWTRGPAEDSIFTQKRRSPGVRVKVTSSARALVTFSNVD